MMRTILMAGAAFWIGGAGQPPAPPPPPPPPAAAPAGPTVSSLAFMAGHWRGQIEGGLSEEQWSGPEGNNMVGMFRWLTPQGTPIMFEMMAITQEPDGIVLRLVHFNAKLVAREGKDEAVTLRLTETAPAKAVFKGVESEKRVASASYERTATGGLHVSIHFVSPDRPPLEFDFAPGGARP